MMCQEKKRLIVSVIVRMTKSDCDGNKNNYYSCGSNKNKNCINGVLIKIIYEECRLIVSVIRIESNRNIKNRD